MIVDSRTGPHRAHSVVRRFAHFFVGDAHGRPTATVATATAANSSFVSSSRLERSSPPSPSPFQPGTQSRREIRHVRRPRDDERTEFTGQGPPSSPSSPQAQDCRLASESAQQVAATALAPRSRVTAAAAAPPRRIRWPHVADHQDVLPSRRGRRGSRCSQSVRSFAHPSATNTALAAHHVQRQELSVADTSQETGEVI